MADFGVRGATAGALAPAPENRVARLSERFRERFGRAPACVAVAPGVVGLMGGHVGMDGLPLLSLATDRQTLVAAAPRTDRRVSLANTAAEYEDCSFLLQAGIRRFAPGHWGNYGKAAAQAAVSTLGPETLRGGDLLVDADLPSGVGLRSSTSLIAASLFGLLGVNDRDPRSEAVDVMMERAELYLGAVAVRADLLTCLGGERGHALWVDAASGGRRSIALPRDVGIVVSPLSAAAAAAVRQLHEARAVECRLICRVLDRALGARVPRSLNYLADLRRFFPDRSLGDFATVLENVLPPRPLSLAEIAARIGTAEEHLGRAVGIARPGGETFRIVERARYLVTEADRVERAALQLALGDGGAAASLLAASHGSARDDYAMVPAEVEALVTACRQSGAAGSRIACSTAGACVVSIVAASEVTFFLAMMERRRIAARELPIGLSTSFPVRAADGAALRATKTASAAL